MTAGGGVGGDGDVKKIGYVSLDGIIVLGYFF
jgi:hypothetical protein